MKTFDKSNVHLYKYNQQIEVIKHDQLTSFRIFTASYKKHSYQAWNSISVLHGTEFSVLIVGLIGYLSTPKTHTLR